MWFVLFWYVSPEELVAATFRSSTLCLSIIKSNQSVNAGKLLQCAERAPRNLLVQHVKNQTYMSTHYNTCAKERHTLLRRSQPYSEINAKRNHVNALFFLLFICHLSIKDARVSSHALDDVGIQNRAIPTGVRSAFP